MLLRLFVARVRESVYNKRDRQMHLSGILQNRNTERKNRMRKQLLDLRQAMADHGIDYYLVVTDDFHASEYTGAYFKCRAYLTGFTGSAGSCLVSRDFAGLWTDGRYFLQAADQLKDSGIELEKMEEPGVPTLDEYIRTHLKEGQVLGFDGRTVSTKTYRKYCEMAEKAGAKIVSDVDLAGDIWKDRPPLSAQKVFELDLSYTGKSRADKLAEVRKALKDQKCDALILSSLMDINWLLNIRGGDVAHTPVVLSYAIIRMEDAELFINPDVLSPEIRSHLEADGIRICPYFDILSHVSALPDGMTVLLNPALVNSAIVSCIPAGVHIVENVNPTELAKAIKNPVEVANFRKAHIKDGVAVTRFMRWVKTHVGKEPMDEISVAEKLLSFRRQMENFVDESFSPIMAYGPHGAIVHYGATEETNARIEPRSFLLSDTGGHYLEGTTDITRTYALGELTEEEKKCYTLVLKGHLQLGSANFRYGTTGYYLDYAARKPLWDLGMDYNHGTGHGVGYLMSVHEGPQSFSLRMRQDLLPARLEPGMVTSDEPGLYLEGKFGVRLENLTVVCESETTSFGRFLHLEYLTMVPWDLDAVVPEMLTDQEKAWLNDYHRQVREALSPYFDDEENAWLNHATRSI